MILYRGPIGDTRNNPDREFLRAISEKPAEYWAQGGGDSCIEVEGSNERLLFFYDEPYGFFVMMHPDYYVVVSRTTPIDTVEHRVGGEPMKLPTCSYMGRDEALRLMIEFSESGKRPVSVEWQDMYDIDFDHGF